MKKIIILLFLSLWVCLSFSQNKRQTIDLLNLKFVAFENEVVPVKLNYGHSYFSIDKFLKINNNLLLAYNRNMTTFYLINLKDNLIIDQLSLFKLKEITQNEFDDNTFDISYLLKNIRTNDNSFFNLSYNFNSFEKLNDSIIFIGFFKPNETKFGTGIQLNLKIANNKINPEFFKFNTSIFEDFKKDNTVFKAENAFDASTLFAFNKEQYYYFIYLPIFNKNTNNSSPLLNNVVIKKDNSGKMHLVSKSDGNLKYRSKNYVAFENYLFDYYTSYPTLNDSIILRDTSFKIKSTIPIKEIVKIENTKRIQFFADEKSNKLFFIETVNLDNKSLFNYNIYEVSIDNFDVKPKLKKTKNLISDTEIQFDQILDNQFLFKYRNSLINTNYIYSIDFNNKYYENTDTLFLNFKKYININAINYQRLLSEYNKNGYNYKPSTKFIKKNVFENSKVSHKEYLQNTIKDLVLSIEECIDLKDYDYFYSNLTAFEDYEYKTFAILVDNNILKQNSALYNKAFFNLVKNDLDYFKENSDQYYFDSFNKSKILKTPSNHYYKFLNDKNKWYLCASVLIENKEVFVNEKQEFARKYNYLNFIKGKNNISFNETNTILDTVKLISVIPDSINKRLFPEIQYMQDSFPQNGTKELISSLKKAILENKIHYMCSQLMIYPIQEVAEISNNNKSKFDTISLENRNMLLQDVFNKIEKKECERKKINKNIIMYSISKDNCITQIYFILLQKRWYMYSVMKAACTG